MRRCPACGAECADDATHVCGEDVGGDGTPGYGEILGERFVLLEKAGEGGAGIVHRAFDRELEVHVALKLLRPDLPEEAIRRFKREIRITRELDHPNVARVFDIGEVEGRRFLTMRWVEGTSLDRRVDATGPLGKTEARRLAQGLVAALAAAHGKGVVHRDVKPANVLVSPDGTPVLVDFGVATGETTSAPDRERGPTPGTPAYMAPEVLRGGVAAPAADLFALALTIAFATTGRRGRPDAPRAAFAKLGRPLSSLLARCLDPDPARRPHDAGVLAGALARSGRVRGFLRLGATVLVAAALGAVALKASEAPPPRRVAVGPLEDRSRRRDVAWLRRGVPDLVADGLERAGARLADPASDDPDVARVDGRVVGSGAKVAVVLDLVSSEGARLASARLESPTGETLFDGVESAVASFAEALGLPVPPSERSSPPPTQDAIAYARFVEALDAMRARRTAEALDGLRAATTRDPGFALAQMHLHGFLQLGVSRAETEAALDRAMENRDRLSPTNQALLEALVQARRRRGQRGRFDGLRAFLRSHPPDGVVYMMIARITRPEPLTLRAVVEEWVRRIPDDAEAHNQLGYVLLRAGDPPGAERAFREYLRLAPGEANAWDSFGDFLREQGRYPEAVEAYDRSSRIDPTFLIPGIHAAEAYLLAGDLETADRRYHRTETPPVEMPNFRRWLRGWVSVAILRADRREAFRRLAESSGPPAAGSRAFVPTEFEAIYRALLGDDEGARRAAAESNAAFARFHGAGRTQRTLAPYAAGIAAFVREDRSAVDAAVEAAHAQRLRDDAEVGDVARLAVLEGLALLLRDDPSAAAERLVVPAGAPAGEGASFYAQLWRARALVRAGRAAQAVDAYAEAASRREILPVSPEAAHEWRPCITEAAALARSRGDEAAARAWESKLAVYSNR